MIPYSKQSILESDISAVSEVLSSDWITQGPKVPEFESALEETLGVKYALGCSSGTAALQLAFEAQKSTACWLCAALWYTVQTAASIQGILT